jgi:hypothetical protein
MTKKKNTQIYFFINVSLFILIFIWILFYIQNTKRENMSLPPGIIVSQDKKFNGLISAEYIGGLGNQLFIISTVLAYGKLLNKKVVFEKKDHSPSSIFRRVYWNSIFKNLTLMDDFSSIEWQPIFEEQIKSTIHFPKNTLLKGHFGNFNFFDPYKDYIREVYEMDRMQKDLSLKKHPFKKEIGIHFRLGDYKNLQEIHPLLPDSYYRNALRECYTGKEKILLFCERSDHHLVRKRLPNIFRDFKNVDYEFYINEKNDELLEMIRISVCEKIIIANSTYSWWSAYFSVESYVYLPSKWFHEPVQDELFYKHWKKVPVE